MELRARRIAAWACLLLCLAFPAPAAESPGVLRATLSNGLRVVVVPNGLAPVVTTEMNYLVGSNEAPKGFPGMAHALEHMMFRGSPGLSGDQLSTLLAALGGESNASTQQVATQYFLTVPADMLGIALRLEAARMKGVLSTEGQWAKERGAIGQEVAQDLSNPGYILYTSLLAALFEGTPYAHDALGTRPSFARTTGRMLRAFHESWYAPNNAVLVVAGDVDPRSALRLVRRAFGGIAARPLPARPGVRLRPLAPAAIAVDTDDPYGTAVVAWRLPGFESPDFAAGQLLADVLDSRRGALYRLVTEGKALSSGFDGDALPKAGYGYARATFPRGADGPALVAELKRVVAGVVGGGIPPDLVEASRRREIADAEFRRDSVEGLAAAWSQALAVEGRNSPDDDIEAFRKVTVADVNRVAREWLVDDTAVTAVMTPRPSGGAVAGHEGSARGSESFAPGITRPVPLPAWARKAVGLPPAPRTRVAPSDSVLPNGIRLIVVPESESRTVEVRGVVRNSDALQEPPGKEGVGRVLAALLPYGTTSLSRLAFLEAQDNIAADISLGASFSLRVLSDRFERGVELLADGLRRPALPDAAFGIVRRQTADEVRGERESPSWLSQRALRTALCPPGDPALRETTPESVGALSPADVRAYHRDVFRPDLTTLVVVGDVTPDRAREAVLRFFGDWKAEGPPPATDLPGLPPNAPSAATVPDASRVQDDVTLAATLGITRSHPDFYPLTVGNNVLSGGFYATRLYRDLRARAGLVYFVESIVNAGKTRSTFLVRYACDPPNVSKARGLVERNLRGMGRTAVSPAELVQAKTLLLRRIPLTESSVGGIAHGLVGRALQGLPLDEPVRAAARYREITAEEVREAFAKWVRPETLVQVTRGPNPG